LPAAAFVAVVAAIALTAPAAAHEHRHVAGYDVVVGMIGEPVFTGQKSGLEFNVETEDGTPVTGLADTLQAQAIYGSSTRDLPLSPRFGADGWYQSVFFPTAAGPYTFRIFGTINGVAVDESFSAGEDTFGEVEEATTGQFPVALPPADQVAADAERGASAADQLTWALLLGGAGVLLGLAGLAVGWMAMRRRSA
jgi:hypothetical protein